MALPFSTISGARIEFIILVFVVLFAYFFPTMVATHRKVVNVGSVFVVNLFFGWSLFGWAIALAMAVRTYTTKTSEISRPTSALSPVPPPPGWYIDPNGQGVRWWDGLQWTEHVALPAGSSVVG